MDDFEQYKLSLVSVLEGIREDILSLHGDIYMARGMAHGMAHGIRLSVEAIKRGVGEPIDYSSDLDVLLIDKDKQ